MCHVMCQNEATRVKSQVLKRGQFSRGLSISPLASSIGVGGTRTFSNLMTPLTLFNEAL